MMQVLRKRVDGSFVIDFGRGEYHTLPGDEYFEEAQRIGEDAPLDPDVAPEQGPPTLEERRQTASMPKGDFLNDVADRGIISDNDAVAAAKGEWPASMATFLSLLDPRQKRDIQITWADAINVNRTDPFLMIFASWYLPSSETESTLDAIFAIEA